jgi:hypothetical protein
MAYPKNLKSGTAESLPNYGPVVGRGTPQAPKWLILQAYFDVTASGYKLKPIVDEVGLTAFTSSVASTEESSHIAVDAQTIALFNNPKNLVIATPGVPAYVLGFSREELIFYGAEISSGSPNANAFDYNSTIALLVFDDNS